MNTIQYSLQSGPLSVHKLFTSYIRRCLLSLSREWCQRYVLCHLCSVSNLVCFSSMSVHEAAKWRYTQYRTSDVTENLLVRGV